MDDFLATLIGDPHRARIMRLFALNQSEVFTTSQVAKRSGVSRSVVGRELRALEKMGIVKKAKFAIQVGGKKRKVAGKQKEAAWAYDAEFKHAAALSRFVHEVSPIQHRKIVETLKRSGRLSLAILSGNFMGDPTRPADLIVAFDVFNENRIGAVIRGLEPAFGREIRYAAFSTPEFRYRMTTEDRLIRETLDYPHLVLLDRAHLL